MNFLRVIQTESYSAARNVEEGDLSRGANGWQADDPELELAPVFEVQENVFDSGIFGHSVGRVAKLAIPSHGEAWRESLAELRSSLAFELVSLRVPLSELAFVSSMVTLGATIVDTQDEFLLDGRASSAGGDFANSTVTPLLSPPREDDVLELARGLRHHGRVASDPRLGPIVSEKFYRTWLENNLRGRTDNWVVLDRNERIQGAICLQPKLGAFGSAMAVDLLVVAAEAQGRGVGRALVDTAIVRARAAGAALSVGTQGSNIPAKRLYLRAGFLPVRAMVTLHWWK